MNKPFHWPLKNFSTLTFLQEENVLEVSDSFKKILEIVTCFKKQNIQHIYFYLVLFGEMTRILNHIMGIGTHILDVGGIT